MIDIESLIPHREPIRIITDIIELKDNSGIAAAVVNEHWPLCDGRTVGSLILIEALAQTAALVESYKRKKEGKDSVKGWLVGIKSAEFKKDFIPLGTRITVAVRSLYAFDEYGVIEGEVKSGDDILLTAILQAIRLNHDVS
ncbi:MAG: FabA-like domain protein [Syntrophaceae bacterium]|nr:MAG: FabA-like domain protein [Syntrophaceae bacterium]